MLLPPPPSAPSAPVCHGYAYLALELQALPTPAEVHACPRQLAWCRARHRVYV
jgi:hypothetical protein